MTFQEKQHMMKEAAEEIRKLARRSSEDTKRFQYLFEIADYIENSDPDQFVKRYSTES